MTTAAELDQHFIETVGGLPGGPARPDPAAPVRPGSRLDGATLLGHLRRPGAEPAAGLRGAVDAAAGPRLLHDRLGRPRGQRRGGRGAAADRPGAAALPVRRVLLRPRAPGGRHRPGPRRPARGGRIRRRADRRRAAQGVRPRRAGHHPADVDDRLAPAARARRRAGHRPGGEAGRALPVAARRGGGGLVRRRLGQPLDRRRRGQRRLPHRRTRASRSRCCSSARTTGSGSACRPRAGGSRPPTASGPACGTWPPTAATRSRPTTRPPRRRALVRSRRRPVFLHLSVVRFLGHAGSDAEAAYRAPAELAADLARDPLVATAGELVRAGLLTPGRGRGPLRRDRRPGPRGGRPGAGQQAAVQRRRGDGPAGAASPGPGGRAGPPRPGRPEGPEEPGAAGGPGG